MTGKHEARTYDLVNMVQCISKVILGLRKFSEIKFWTWDLAAHVTLGLMALGHPQWPHMMAMDLYYDIKKQKFFCIW